MGGVCVTGFISLFGWFETGSPREATGPPRSEFISLFGWFETLLQLTRRNCVRVYIPLWLIRNSNRSREPKGREREVYIPLWLIRNRAFWGAMLMLNSLYPSLVDSKHYFCVWDTAINSLYPSLVDSKPLQSLWTHSRTSCLYPSLVDSKPDYRAQSTDHGCVYIPLWLIRNLNPCIKMLGERAVFISLFGWFETQHFPTVVETIEFISLFGWFETVSM